MIETLTTLAVATRSSGSLDDLLYYGSSSSSSEAAAVWVGISAILAIIGGLLIYFLFVKKKDNPANKFLAWLKRFLAFDKMVIEDFAKIFYIVGALFITLSSFSLLGGNGGSFLAFILTLIFGNIAARLGYELLLIIIMIWSNTTKIKDSLAKEEKAKK